jgi:hypothetical protein
MDKGKKIQTNISGAQVFKVFEAQWKNGIANLGRGLLR